MSQETENIARIRDILFGNNMTDFEKRLLSVEQQMQTELGLLEQRLTAQLKAQRSDLDLLNEKINQLIDDQNKWQSELKSVVENELKSLSVRLSDIQSLTDDTMKGNKQYFDEQLQTISSELNHQTQAYYTMLKQQLHQLQSSKLESSSLAVMLSELAIKLSHNMPEAESEKLSEV